MLKISDHLSELMEKGNNAFNNGEYIEAKKYYNYGCDYSQRKNDDLNYEIFRYWYAYCDYKIGNYILALRNFQINLDNLKLLKKMKYPYEYQTYYSLAGVYEKLGQWTNTKQMLEMALQTDHVKDNPEKCYFIIWYLGDVYREQGKFGNALENYNKAMEYFKSKEQINQILNLNIDIAKLKLKEGKFNDSLELIQTTREKIFSSDKYDYLRDNVATTIAELAVYALENEMENALNIIGIAVDILEEEFSRAESSNSFSDKLKCLSWLSRFSSLTGKTEIFEKTEDFIEENEQRIIKQYHSLEDTENIIQLCLDLGNYYYAQISEPGQNLINLKALDYYKKTDFFVDKATAKITSPNLRRDFHVKFTYIAYKTFSLYQTIYQEYWEDFLYESLGILEKYKGYDLFLSLEAASGRQVFLNQLNEINYDLEMKKRYLKKEMDLKKKEELINEIDKLENKYFDIENEMIIKYHSWITVKDPVELMEETMGLINPLINYYKYGILYLAMNENVLYIIAFTKNDVQREIIEFDKEKLFQAEKLLKYFRDNVETMASEKDFILFDKILKKLSRWATKNIITQKMINILRDIDYLTIIPSGFLINFPLEIIKIEDEYFGTKFKLSREFNLKFVSKQIKDIKWHKRQRKPHLDLLKSEDDVLFISNPNYKEYLVYEKSDIEYYVIDEDKIAKSRNEYNQKKESNEEIYLESECFPLDLGDTEVQDLKEIFDKKEIKYKDLINDEVSKEKLLKSLNNNIKIFHFAGHALFDNENPSFSKLILRNNKVMTPMDFQKYTFNQNPLIIFSACESGVSEVREGDEPFGFLRFAKIMNAQNIIFSLWPVLSDVTTQLMIKFYKRLLKGHEIAESMRYARAQIIDMVNNNEKDLGFYNNLEFLYWSPFSFIGFPFFAYSKEVLK